MVDGESAQRGSAENAYDRYASIYDESNAQNDYETWLGKALLPELVKHGLRKGWVLDVGCGTGRAFEPLLNRDWKIVGCDVSSGMLAEAERKFGDRVQLFHADARAVPAVSPAPDLPEEGAFDLVLLLNDVLNYMVEDGDLEQAFMAVKRNLNPEHGLVAFDGNVVGLYADSWIEGVSGQMNERGWHWRGLTKEARAGIVYEAELSGEGVETHLHRQRHWLTEEVKEALASSGLELLAVLGQHEEGSEIILAEPPDEERDYKLIYVARCA
jgi:SAM-dependent methyltransferase